MPVCAVYNCPNSYTNTKLKVPKVFFYNYFASTKNDSEKRRKWARFAARKK
jgi:hypothetical protein